MVHKTNTAANNLLLKSDDEKPQVFERQCAGYNDLSNFTKRGRDFAKQFAHIYAARLKELRNVLEKQVFAKWGDIPIKKLAELEDFEGEKCVIIGTLYKHQQWKPSILRELSEDHQLAIPTPRADYCSEKDQAYLEDEMSRIKLVGEHVDIKEIITGVVCAVLGHEDQDSSFAVDDWCFSGCVPKNSIRQQKSVGKVVLMSGLDLSSSSPNLPLSLLSEWLCGMAGNMTVQEDGASIVRVIIAGNTIKNTENHSQDGRPDTKAQEQAIMKEITAATNMADSFISEIAKCCSVTLMPGHHDPTNLMMPQKPLHPCVLPKSSRLDTFKGATNPWVGKIGDRCVVGTSGQPIRDIMKVSGVESGVTPLEWLEKTLIWRHVCPTAPDTLPSYPYYDEDLFIMKECPDIYFTGNMDKYETKLWKGDDNHTVRLICIPQFSTSYTVVTVDLENLDTDFICFGSE